MMVGTVCGRYELTSPVVAVRNTFLPEQKLVEFRISVVGGSCGLRYDHGRTVARVELGADNPHAVQNHREASGDGVPSPHATPLSHLHAPRFQPRPFSGVGKQRPRSLVEHRT